MDLPNLLNRLKSSPPPAHQFVAIEITPYAVKSAIWQVQGEVTTIVSLGSVQAWESHEDADLLTAIDASLADAYAGVSPQPNEVIFGLPDTWVHADTITEGQKPRLKTICHKLALKPVGFVVSTEALIHHLKDLEGGPPSAVLINLAPEEIGVSLAYLGDLLGTQHVGRSQSLSADVAEGLARFPGNDTLPSRMILYDARDDLEAAKQELIAYDWQAKLPFLHFPKIESLGKDVSIQAVAIAGGAEVAKSMGLTPPPESQPSPAPEPEPAADLEPSLEPTSPTTFGFQPVALTKVLPSPPSISPPFPEPPPSLEVSPPPHSRFQVHLPHLPRFPRFRLTRPRFRLPGILPLVLAFILLFGSGFLVIFGFILRAQVDLTIRPQSLATDLSFTLDPKLTEVDLNQSIIPATPEDITVSGVKSVSTTGTKLIGDKAQGKVALYNRTTSSKTFPAGTSFKYNNLFFLTEDPVTLASASAQSNSDFSITLTPTKTEVSVVADKIGDTYNLPAGVEFTVQNYAKDSFVASSTIAFTGGYSRTVQVVSASDRTNLQTALTQDLTSQITQEVHQKSAGKEGVISTGQIEPVSLTFDHDIKDEASSLTLNATLKETVYRYQLANLILLAQGVLLKQISPGYSIDRQATQVSVASSSANSNQTITVGAHINLSLMPHLDTVLISQKLVHQTLSQAQAYLRTLTGYESATIHFRPPLFGVFQLFPWQPKAITVSLKAV